MTGIVLCEISSGLSIEPRQLPSGVVGDDTPVLLVTTGAVGAVEWGFALPGNPALYGLPPGRSLTDNGDGTATLTGTFERGGSGPYVVYAWDGAGQVAKIEGHCEVSWNAPLSVQELYTSGVDTHLFVTGGVGRFENANWTFAPALPAGWHDSDAIGGGTTERVVTGVVGQSWAGYVYVQHQENWSPAGGHTVIAQMSIDL